jgi:hypothetical protein
VQAPRHPGTSLIEVGDLGPAELLANPLDEFPKPLGGLGRKSRQHPSRHAGPQRIAEHLRGTLHRHVMGHHQVARQPANPSAIACRRAGLVGKHPSGDLPTAALAPFGPMLTHPQPHLGQIKDLPGLHPNHRRQGQIPTTVAAAHRPVHHHLVRVSHLGQVRTRRAGLLARRPSSATPLPPGRGRLAKPVRRRRLGGIGGVLAKTPLQLSHPSLKCGIGRHQPGVGLP